MDVATLVAALALGATPIAVPAVAPNVMHALIWEQSRGSPGRSRPPTNCAAGVPQRPDPHRIDELADLAAYTVNVASRLLEIAKDRHAEIVISEDLIYRAATEIPDAEMERRNDIVAEVTIRGRAQPVLVRIAQCELGQPR